jgi:hypothetical protein
VVIQKEKRKKKQRLVITHGSLARCMCMNVSVSLRQDAEKPCPPTTKKQREKRPGTTNQYIHTVRVKSNGKKSKERNLGTNVQKGKDAYKQRVRRRKMEVREGWRRADKKQGFSRVTNSPQQTHGIFGRRTTISYYSITGSTALYWRHSSVRMND